MVSARDLKIQGAVSALEELSSGNFVRAIESTQIMLMLYAKSSGGGKVKGLATQGKKWSSLLGRGRGWQEHHRG